MAKLGNRAMCNLSSAGWQSAKFTVGTADKAAVGVFRRSTKGHVRCLPARLHLYISSGSLPLRCGHSKH